MASNVTPMHDKTLTQRLADLEHDNRHLYFVIGALTDTIDQLPQLHRQKILSALKAKAEHTTDDMQDTLHTLIESMEREEE